MPAANPIGSGSAATMLSLLQGPTDACQRSTQTGTLTASALLAQLVEHFHGKEGVVGSSPTEGFRRISKGFIIVA